MDDKGKEELVDKVFGLRELTDSDIRRNIQKSSEENPGSRVRVRIGKELRKIWKNLLGTPDEKKIYKIFLDMVLLQHPSPLFQLWTWELQSN